MKAYQLHGPRDIRPAEMENPQPGPGEVRVRVARAGICGSDVHYYLHGRAGDFVMKRPFVLGHEFAGEVAEVGEGVRDLEPGMRVAVDPSQACGECRFCRKGRYNLCEDMRYFGSASRDPHIDGAFAEYIVAPALNCHPVPDGMSFGEAAMLEPLSVSLHAVKRAGDVVGARVLIMGGGPIGQLAALSARALGAAQIVLNDLDAFPRQFALENGVDAVLDAADPEAAGRAADLAPGGFDVAIEATGASQALAFAIEAVARGGTIIQVGTLQSDAVLPANLIMAKELAVLGSFRFAHIFPVALQLVAAGKIDVVPLITRTYPFSELPEGMELASSKDQVIKVQVAQ